MVANQGYFINFQLSFVDLLVVLSKIRLILLGNLEEDIVELVVVLVNWIINNIIAFNLALQPPLHVLGQILNPVLVLQQLVMHLLDLYVSGRLVQRFHAEVSNNSIGDIKHPLNQFLLESNKFQVVVSNVLLHFDFSEDSPFNLISQLHFFLFLILEQIQQLVKGHFADYVFGIYDLFVLEFYIDLAHCLFRLMRFQIYYSWYLTRVFALEVI